MHGKIAAVLLASLALVALTGILLPSPSMAALSLVTSRGALAGNDFVDWGVLGVENTSLLSPSTATCNSGTITATISNVAGFFRLNQSSSYPGNFATGDRLILNNDNGPMTIEFSTAVFGAGAQMQGKYYGNFYGVIEAFDAGNNFLGSFQFAGVSNGNGDNSAIFLGVMDTNADIAKIVFDVIGNDGLPTTFAINQLDLKSPLPGTLVLLGSGLLGLVGLRRKFKK